MTFAQLREVEESRAFEATRRFEELAFFHVPFDELNGDTQTEDALQRLAVAGARLGIIGESGCGKSSVISWVLGPFSPIPDQVVPIRVPVAAADDSIVVDPGRMARYLVRYVTKWASPEQFTTSQQEDLRAGVAEVQRRGGKEKVREFHIGLPAWLARGEFASQVKATGIEYETAGEGADAIEHLRRMLDVFAANELSPILVFDDSDTWLKIADSDRTSVASGFFLRTIRMLAKDVDIGLVLSLHNQYLGLPAFAEARQWLSAEVTVPRLIEAASGVDRILRDRLVMAELGDANLEGVLEADAVAFLAKFYESGRTVRDLLRVAQRSVQHALSDGADVVTTLLVEQAMGELAH